MAGTLMILFKEKDVPLEQIEHLADFVIFNQYVAVPGSNPPRFVEFEANEEEIKRLLWLSQFSQQDILYVLDRDIDNLNRLKESSGTIGGVFRFADIILVQLNADIFCIKNMSGFRPRLKLAIRPTEKIDEIKVAQNILRQANIQRESLLQSYGMYCRDCDFSEAPSALCLYKFVTSGVARIPMVKFGQLRSFSDIQKDMEDGTILCLNCANIRNNIL